MNAPTLSDQAAKNRDGLQKFVVGHLKIAQTKSPPEAEAHLMRWAAWLDGKMERLGLDVTPPELVGLTAWDIAWARDTLVSAVNKRVPA